MAELIARHQLTVVYDRTQPCSSPFYSGYHKAVVQGDQDVSLFVDSLEPIFPTPLVSKIQ